MSGQTRPLGRGLYCRHLDWLLLTSESAGGARGTMGGVISAIERGGGAAYVDSNAFNYAMLRRIGHGERGHENLARAETLWARWLTLDDATRQILHAAYIGSKRTPQRVRSRFDGNDGSAAMISGVVALQWVDRAERRRAQSKGEAIDALRDALCETLDDLAPIEERLSLAKARECDNRPGGGRVLAKDSPQRRFRSLSTMRLLEAAARPLRTARDGLLARLSTAEQAEGVEADLDALTRLCEAEMATSFSRMASVTAGLAVKAEQAIRAAHDAWYASEQVPKTVVEARVERVSEFLAREGLA